MTVAEQIKSRVDKLKPRQQKTVLNFLESLQPSRGAKRRPTKAPKSRRAEVSAALRGIAGMWKDRTDLPKDPVEAVKALRARMWSRGRHG